MNIGEIPARILKEFMKKPLDILAANIEKFVSIGNNKDSLMNFQKPYEFFLKGKNSCIMNKSQQRFRNELVEVLLKHFLKKFMEKCLNTSLEKLIEVSIPYYIPSVHLQVSQLSVESERATL